MTNINVKCVSILYCTKKQKQLSNSMMTRMQEKTYQKEHFLWKTVEEGIWKVLDYWSLEYVKEV